MALFPELYLMFFGAVKGILAATTVEECLFLTNLAPPHRFLLLTIISLYYIRHLFKLLKYAIFLFSRYCLQSYDPGSE